ncbi:VOC family protein [Geomesophilobacter sediminis]|uniref:VOC family protein n=1 Tax=Geomesophilobacter sediminis TaxID=2798584 RepID=A0A8J7J9X3_9BACT|nr:VOC family protein [Geomesophilobacter sediminis]MBJ6723546.1 VOC family protein [Geomesophilobacter sediminis]
MDQFRQHGAISWFELRTSDPKGAESFYTRIFGWTTEPWLAAKNGYSLIKVDGKQVGGICSPHGEGTGRPTAWGVYVTVADVDATAARAVELGGKLLVAPRDIPKVGRFCVIEDPQGGVVSAITYLPGITGQ